MNEFEEEQQDEDDVDLDKLLSKVPDRLQEPMKRWLRGEITQRQAALSIPMDPGNFSKAVRRYLGKTAIEGRFQQEVDRLLSWGYLPGMGLRQSMREAGLEAEAYTPLELKLISQAINYRLRRRTAPPNTTRSPGAERAQAFNERTFWDHSGYILEVSEENGFPKALLEGLGIKGDDYHVLIGDRGDLILRPAHPRCSFCRRVQDVALLGFATICKQCWGEIQEAAPWDVLYRTEREDGIEVIHPKWDRYSKIGRPPKRR